MRLQNKRIFVVEDNLANLAITKIILEREGAKIAFERWGTETLSALHGFAPIDLILLDLMFPRGVSGFDVFDTIHSHEAFKYVPIVAVSASDPGFAIPEAQKRGFHGFISKPLEFNLFGDQIVRILAGEKIWYTQSQF